MHLMLSCVSFEEVSQANETFNSGADGNLAKASFFPRQADWDLEKLRR